MGDLRLVDRRREERTAAELALLVWGVDTHGERFAQQAWASEISQSGALISGLEGDLHSGDVVGVLYAGRKARFRIVWVRFSGTHEKVQAAVQRLDGDACPWEDLLAKTAASEVEVSPEGR